MDEQEVRLIDANKFASICINQAEHALENGRQEIYATMMYVAKDLLENQPTIDPDSMRSNGKWILRHVGVGHYWECSACHKNPCIYVTNNTRYCPNCGAKMDGEENG